MWPFLLEVFDHASTYAQRQHQHYLMTSQYQQLLLQCQVKDTPAGLLAAAHSTFTAAGCTVLLPKCGFMLIFFASFVLVKAVRIPTSMLRDARQWLSVYEYVPCRLMRQC